MILVTVVHSQLEEALQLKDAVTQETGVISLANAGYCDSIQAWNHELW